LFRHHFLTEKLLETAPNWRWLSVVIRVSSLESKIWNLGNDVYAKTVPSHSNFVAASSDIFSTAPLVG